MWDTVLFDLDGTLTDSEEGIVNSIAYALSYFGVRKERAELKKFIGPLLVESLPEYCGFNREQTEEATVRFREYFEERGWLENAPYPGVEDMLRDLRGAGLGLMVATSKPEAQAVRILEHFGLAAYFTHICGAPQSTGDGARKSSVIRRALSYAGPGTAVMVGDRRHDVAGAHETGLECIGVLYGYGGREELEQAGAEYIAEDFNALRRLLLSGGEGA